MAGTVAKLVFPHKVPGPNGDGYHTSRNAKVMRNMEEDDILNQLSDSNFNRRADILEQLRSAARKNGGRLPFQDQKAIFRGFAMALADSDWDVRHQCIQLIHELIPHFGDDLDDCMNLILPRLVPNMGDSKITIRRSVIQTLHVYMKHTYDIQQTFRAIVQYGLENQQSRVKKEVIIALPMMFTPEFNGEDFFDITQSLSKKLLDNSGDESIQQHALLSLDKIRKLVGDSTFSSYLQKLSPPLRKYYIKLSGGSQDMSFPSSSNSTREDLSSITGKSVVLAPSVDNYTMPDQNQGIRIHIPSGDKYEYGVIPSHIFEKLKDQSNFRSRAQAVEELKILLRDISDVDVHKMSPHVLNFINFLNSLLEDPNFKITTVTLEILGLLVKRQGPSMKTHLKPLVCALTKRMGDNKIVIRQVIMKVVMQLMQVLSAKYVLSAICENLSHRNSRVRQETLNIVIASLLTFPSYDFDLSELCDTVAHTLVDPKRQVRQAALECYAVIASNLGAGKLQPLVSSVDAVELSYDGDGVMAAVQARLARRILPKLNADGLVDYATPVPTSAGSRGGSVNLPPGADIEWILSASGVTGGSARSVRSDLEIESVTSSARTTPLPHDSPSHGPTPRRVSAGRGKGRLPWEDTDSSFMMENGYSSQSNRHPRQKQVMSSTSGSRDQSPEPGSYRQMYLQQKQKKQNSEGSSQPFSVYNPNRDEESHSALSTPRNTDDNSRMTYSNSWPDDPGKSNKRLLEPIADNEVEPDNSPIPTKPALARGTSSRSSSKRKVPPIPVSEKKSERREIDPKDSARDSALDDGFDDIDAQDEMQQSLRQIRNSATRKKVDKIFEVLDKEHKKLQVSRSPSPPDMESGIYSNISTRSGFDEPDSSKPTPNKKGFVPSLDTNVTRNPTFQEQALPQIQSTHSDETQYKGMFVSKQNLSSKADDKCESRNDNSAESDRGTDVKKVNDGKKSKRKSGKKNKKGKKTNQMLSDEIGQVKSDGQVQTKKYLAPLPKIATKDDPKKGDGKQNKGKGEKVPLKSDGSVQNNEKDIVKDTKDQKKSFLSSVSDAFKLSFSRKKPIPSIEKEAPVIAVSRSTSPVVKYIDDVVAHQSDNVLDHDYDKKLRYSDNGIYCQSDSNINEFNKSEYHRAALSPLVYSKQLENDGTLAQLEKCLISEIKKCEQEPDPQLALSCLRQSLPALLKTLHSNVSDEVPGYNCSQILDAKHGDSSARPVSRSLPTLKYDYMPPFSDDESEIYSQSNAEMISRGSWIDSSIDMELEIPDDSNKSIHTVKEIKKSPRKSNVIIPRGTKALEQRRSNALAAIEKYEEKSKKLCQNRQSAHEESIFNRGQNTYNTPKRAFLPVPPKKPKPSSKANVRNRVKPASEVEHKEHKLNTKTNKVAGRAQKKLYKTPNYLRESCNIKSTVQREKEVEDSDEQVNISTKKSLCVCLNCNENETRYPFSPFMRKKRLDRYLNDFQKLPRYTQLYNMYKEGKVCVCSEHIYISEENYGAVSGIYNRSQRSDINVEAQSMDRNSPKTTRIINGEIHDVFTDIKDGVPFKYLKKRTNGNDEDASAKKQVSKAKNKKESAYCVIKDNKNKHPKERSDEKQKRIVVRESGIKVNLKSALDALPVPTTEQSDEDTESDLSVPLQTRPKYRICFTSREQVPVLGDLIEDKTEEEAEEQLYQSFVKKGENPFESKPRLVRKPTQPAQTKPKGEREPVKAIKGSGSSSSVLSSNSVAQLDFSPHGGVTFKENRGLSLQMVGTGMGYGEDSHPNPHPNEQMKVNSYTNKARERRRVVKGLVSSSSQSSMSSPEENDGVVGYGVFEGQTTPIEQAIGPQSDRKERKLSYGSKEQESGQILGGVFGVGVRQNSIDKYDDNDFEVDDDDTKAIAISQATRATVQMKVQQKKEEAERVKAQKKEDAERARVEREKQKLRELEEKKRKQEAEIQREKERQVLRLRGLNDQPDQDDLGLAVSGSGSQQNYNGQPTYAAAPKPPTTKPANTTPASKRKVRAPSEDRTPSLGSAKSSSEPESPDNLKPFKEPQRAFDEAMKGLTQDDWNTKCAAINNIRRLAAHHPSVLTNNNLHTLNLAMISEVKNLRSQVSRLAIICQGEMFLHLKKSMEADLDQIATVLVAKAGESNNFIRDDTERALQYMIGSVTQQRAMLSLIAAGASHRNPAVRKTASYFLVPVLEKMGPGRLLSGIKDVTDKVLPVAANFLLDAQPDTRYNGQKIFYMLMSHEDFDKVINKHLPQSTLRNISDKLDTLKRKGLAEPPAENGSAKKRGSSHGSRISSSVRYHSATVGSGGHNDHTPSSTKHRSALPRTDEATVEDIKSYCNMMTASDWRERQNGIIQMQKMVEHNPAVVGSHIIKIFDKFVPCLKDSNSKVNLFALQIMEELAKDLSEYMGSVVNYTIQTVSSNLSSKNKDIYESACNVLDTFMEVLDSTILLQPFCNQAQSGNSRIKPDMVERVAYLVTCVYPIRPRQVILHVLPLLWHLLGTVSQSGATQGGTGNIRIATNHLVHSLYSRMSDTLVENAKNNSTVTPRMMQCLQDMIDNPAPNTE